MAFRRGVSTKGSVLTYFWLHTAFLPAADPETGEVQWMLHKEQLDKFKDKDSYLDTFAVKLTLDEEDEESRRRRERGSAGSWPSPSVAAAVMAASPSMPEFP